MHNVAMKNPFAAAVDAAGDSYLPVYGSTVTPDDFTFAGGMWHVDALGPDGRQRHYELDVIDKNFVDGSGDLEVLRAFINGTRVMFKDIHSLRERPASPLDWYDAITYYDAKGLELLRQDPRWAGESVETMMERVKHNVVSIHQEVLRLGHFATAADLAAALREILSATPLKVEVRPVVSWPADAETAPADGQGDFAQIIATGEGDKFTLLRNSTDNNPLLWFESMSELRLTQHAFASFDGTHVLHAQAAVAQRLSELPDHVVFGDESRTDDQWWALCFPQLDVLIMIPKDTSALTVTIDGDGQQITVMSEFVGHFARRRRLEDAHERRWAWLADDTRTHSEEDIRNAIADALNKIGAQQ
ncbi:hypothetical protein CAQUA_07580 [Corynebacterium aquatimens]|nr:hypothetical protein CAQUA_07580 [Corynebacterium aquatimens]